MTPLLKRLMGALRCLPGVGPKSAQRMALHLLERDREGAALLVSALSEALERVGHCQTCRTLSETTECTLCSDTRRDASQLCVVENPADVLALEAVTGYQGRYFVLMGRLSPLDGIGPEDLGLMELGQRLASGRVRELILATNPTVEGEATAYYIAELARESAVKVTRIARGVPVGGELEYVDGGTLARAFAARRQLDEE